MKPFVVITLAAAIAGCSLENQYTETDGTVNEPSLNTLIENVRLSDLAVDQVWADPWLASISWSLESEVPQYSWVLLVDDLLLSIRSSSI